MPTTRSVGLLVNPVAGVGGRLALHGSDHLGDEQRRAALGEQLSSRRMLRALRLLTPLVERGLVVLTPPGAMGGDLVAGLGWPHRLIDRAVPPLTTATDTVEAARQLWDAGVDLVLFAGGDGTAVDVAGAAGPEDVALGVPAGVKMHSAVFAVTPEVAGRLAADYLGTTTAATEACDVVDATAGDEVQRITTLRVPRARAGLQGAKSGGRAGSATELPALGRAVAEAYRPEETWLLGPGGTVAHVAHALGVEHSVAGVDVVAPGRVQVDATEQQLFEAVSTAGKVVLVLGVVGGQGFLLGRGNQQLSPRVLAEVAPDDVHILAAEDKVVALDPPVLLVDCADDTAAEGPLSGYRTVRTSRHRRLVMKVTDARTLL